VRETDVQMARLDRLHNSVGRGLKDDTPLSPRCICEIDKFENRLKRRRLAGVDKLRTVLDAQSKRLNRLSKEMEAALALQMPSTVQSTAQAALRIFTELNSELPNLSAANLHNYRKRLKPALYLAQISATTDPLAKRLATAFRQIHVAVGEWHDWQLLALKAGSVLRSHGKQDGLVPVLEALEEKALHRALSRCRRSAARYVKYIDEVRPLPPRKPVVSDPGLELADDSLEAGTTR
jgi:hypothetical protein